MTHYETLGVLPNAPLEVITGAYRALVRLAHPDLNPGDPAGATRRAQRINAAYEALRDSTRRSRYDAVLRNSGWLTASREERRQYGSPEAMLRAKSRRSYASEENSERTAEESEGRRDESATEAEQRRGSTKDDTSTPAQGAPSTPRKSIRWTLLFGRRMRYVTALLALSMWYAGAFNGSIPRRLVRAVVNAAIVLAGKGPREHPDVAERRLIVYDLRRLSDAMAAGYSEATGFPTEIPVGYVTQFADILELESGVRSWSTVAYGSPGTSCSIRVAAKVGGRARETIRCSTRGRSGRM
jgi:curved DNA-binding protein CbpA